mgnify:CR=1 FL=1
MIDLSVSITHDRFPEIIAKLPDAAMAVVTKVAFDVEQKAKEVCPVDTGALRNSISLFSGQFESISGSTGFLSGFSEPAYIEVGPTMDYSIYVEYGTYKMAAQPYMRPAADLVRPQFIEACERMLKSL